MLLRILLLAAILMMPHATAGQDDEPSTLPVDATNVAALSSVLQIDFTDLPEGLPVDSGWFTLSMDGERAALVRADGGMVVFDTETGALVDLRRLGTTADETVTVIHAAFAWHDHQLAVLHADDQRIFVSAYMPGSATQIDLLLDEVEGQPVRVWWGQSQDVIWVETLAGRGPAAVYRVPLPGSDAEPTALPSAPQASRDAVARNGRTLAPAAVTSTADGEVWRWDLETGAVTGVAQMPGLPRFSRVNDGSGDWLALRDPQGQRLYLLNFADQAQQSIAPLPLDLTALLVVPSGEVIIGVDFDGAGGVGAWTAEDGTFTGLGDYRPCGRSPDMVRLSQDGTTLVIGCDTGLDVWRVQDDGKIDELNQGENARDGA